MADSSASRFPSAPWRGLSPSPGANSSSRLAFLSPSSSSSSLPNLWVRRHRRSVRPRAKQSDEGGCVGGDPYGPYPWESFPFSQAIQWVPKDRITLFTSEGLIQIGGSFVPRRIPFIKGLDTGRRLCIFGFCRSIEMLSDVIEDTVVEHGGKVVTAETVSSGGLQKKLWFDHRSACALGRSHLPRKQTYALQFVVGGGIVEKIYWHCNFL